MEFAKRRRLSFEEKFDNLEMSFKLWEAQAVPGGPFRKNNRQLRADRKGARAAVAGGQGRWVFRQVLG